MILMRKIKRVEFVVCHHSWSQDLEDVLDVPGIIHYHVEDKQWDDVGYQEMIERYRKKVLSINGRPPYYEGAHAKGFNQKSYGICFIGNFDKKEPESDVWIKGLQRVKAICMAYNIPPKNVIGHNETFVMLGKARTLEEAKKKFKTCPGEKFNMDNFRSGLSNILK
jgi:N-acetylmuramoyl-L-alanine amidase